jgi:hypothetical protein
MARLTQYIGLTKRAMMFVAGLQLLSTERTVHGTCGEIITLKEWLGEPAFSAGSLIREVVQATPWSSGVMMFTCLEVEYPNGERKQFAQWITFPDVEFDKEAGTFWV